MVLRDDPRLRDIIRRLKPGASIPKAMKPRKAVAIIGFPFDEGCARNGGRPGAKEGPKAFRSMLYKYGTVTEKFSRNISIIDTGDVGGSTLEAAHIALRERVHEALGMGWIPFCIGGSNDQSFPNALGLLDCLKETKDDTTAVGVINIDAHFDVRPLKGEPWEAPKAHSGSPFRQLLEYPGFDGKFVEYAAQKIQCSEAHTLWLESRGHQIVWYDDDIECMGVYQFREHFKDLLAKLGSELFISFDIDSLRYADCPGVSCPSPIGLTSNQAFKICEISGRNPHVRLMDMSEFNPTCDEYCTGKLVVFMFWYFCQGVAKRQQVAEVDHIWSSPVKPVKQVAQADSIWRTPVENNSVVKLKIGASDQDLSQKWPKTE